MASRDVSSLCRKRVHPHTFRHTAGVQLVAAVVDITVIRSWLGHVSLNTTNHYARANIETKRKAIERIDRSSRPASPPRSEEHTSELQSLMRNSYAVFCL